MENLSKKINKAFCFIKKLVSKWAKIPEKFLLFFSLSGIAQG